MAFTEDLSVFFDPGEFADAAVLTPAAGGTGTPGNVIFDIDGLVLDEFDVQSTGPSGLCPASQWPTVREGDSLAISFASGTLYFKLRAVTPLKDGGLVLMTLAKDIAPPPGLGRLSLDTGVLVLGSDYLVIT